MTSAALDALALPPGTLVGTGRYALEDEIGRGGYGITYRAQRVEDGEAVAVKECFLPGCARDGAEVVTPDDAAARALFGWGERVVAQAERLGELSHPHLARVFEAWREHNTVYVAMELLDGPTLAAHIEANGPLPPDDALLHAGEIAGALGELHSRELVHLDVKPENVILTARGAVLLDFDLVQPCGSEQVSTRPLSLAGRIGTPGYAPPESYGEVAPQGARSDVYSLGATLYFLLGGATPPAAVDRAAGIELPPLPVAPHLQEALAVALQLPIEARPASVEEFRALWVPPPAPPAPEEDYSFSAHAANLAQSQSATGICRVVLTTSNPTFPSRCACCFERADAGVSLILPSASGRQYIPGCAACLRHQNVARASANGTGWGLILSCVLALAGAWPIHPY